MPAADATIHIVTADAGSAESLKALAISTGHQVRVFTSSQAFLEDLDIEQHGCVIADIAMPGIPGLELLARASAKGAVIPFLFVSLLGNVQLAVQALKCGAIDFMEQPVKPALLFERIHEAIALDAERRRLWQQKRELQARYRLLSGREIEVLDLVIEGNASKQIAARLGISQKTVDKHRTSLMVKLHASNASELVRSALVARTTEDDGKIAASELLPHPLAV